VTAAAPEPSQVSHSLFQGQRSKRHAELLTVQTQIVLLFAVTIYAT
jgi:hypothetical protein